MLDWKRLLKSQSKCYHIRRPSGKSFLIMLNPKTLVFIAICSIFSVSAIGAGSGWLREFGEIGEFGPILPALRT
jgi:hypothetical protein